MCVFGGACSSDRESSFAMCLIFCAYKAHPQYPLILAANRDEFYARPALPLSFHADYPDVLMGRDARAQGTWLALALSGRFAAVTNVSGAPAPAQPQSRGALPLGWLADETPAPPPDTPQAYAQQVAATSAQYNGFNLLVGDSKQLCFVSNSTGDQSVQALSPGVYGLANRTLDSDCPKVESGKARLAKVLRHEAPKPSDLLAILSDRQPPAGLADAASPEERALAAALVVTEGYGTRVSMLVMVAASGRYDFIEQQWHPAGVLGAKRRLSGYLDASPRHPRTSTAIYPPR